MNAKNATVAPGRALTQTKSGTHFEDSDYPHFIKIKLCLSISHVLCFLYFCRSSRPELMHAQWRKVIFRACVGPALKIEWKTIRNMKLPSLRWTSAMWCWLQEGFRPKRFLVSTFRVVFKTPRNRIGLRTCTAPLLSGCLCVKYVVGKTMAVDEAAIFHTGC